MQNLQNRKSGISRIIFIAFVLVAIVLAAIPLYHYNTFIFRKAVKEMPSLPAAYTIQLVKLFTFPNEKALKEWEEKIFKGKVSYEVAKDKSISCVKATSLGTASALYYKIKLDSKTKNPIIGWKWKVEKFPVKKFAESLETQNEDDFAARVYVIFPAMFITNSKVLEYIWAETLPVGTTGDSPYSKNIKLIVADTGPNSKDEWRTQERDIIADYIKVFGRKPEYNIGAVAFMTNSEHTGSSAETMYNDIKLGYKEDLPTVNGKGGVSSENEIPKEKDANNK